MLTHVPKVLIFTATKAGADDVTYYLNSKGFPADAIHGNVIRAHITGIC